MGFVPSDDSEKAYRMLSFLSPPVGGLTPRESFERRQRILRAALDTMEKLRLTDDLDESFWDALRQSVLAAGGTDADLDGLASYFICFVVEATGDQDVREQQFELIAKHLCCTDMRIRIGKGERSMSIEYPNRQRIH
jgi:hypothetical protein